ncbi:EF-hand domain-containing protein [Sphingomonas donggukensis]|uniref:EF-hand domain-containing protein n=1 Tax=Sphingomonas donggukensis TaxID=2949093 RepID=A0ABY4TUG6_9SPHN|nr:EF-hand domain-containing protein [Sphingomonas donggukensis]URW76050.1 EF-hand domain-containing protein [Sphingomonas donggukensis]
MILAALPVMAALALTQAAPAQPPRPGDPYRAAPATIVAEPVALLFAGFDRDGDGRTTLAEMRAGLRATASGAEWATGVGYLAFADWAARYLGDRNGVPTPFEVDRNGDNRITLAELEDRVEALFTRYDLDRDGALTRTELLTIRTTPTGERRRRDRDGDQPAMPPRR